MKRFRAYLCALLVIGLVFACRHLKPEDTAPRNPAVKQIPGRPDIEANADRFATYADVIVHYETLLKLNLTPQEKTDLVQFLKSL